MAFRIVACGFLIALSAVGLPMGRISAASATPIRAYYWNIGDGAAAGSATDAGRIAHFKQLGVSEVRLWLNENRATPACGYLFRYTEGGAELWKATRLEQTTRALLAAGLKVVYILSPDIRTEGYIKSLSAPGGPLDVAKRVTGVDIELDIEGNGASSTLCPGEGLSVTDADTRLLGAVHGAGAKLVISTIRGYDAKHPILMQGADAISPQLYENHYASPYATALANFSYFRKTYPTTPLWVALSVECSEADAEKGLCSQDLFDSEVRLVTDANVADAALVPKYVIWGEREARQCPAKPLCSVFAQADLTAPAKP